MSIVYLKSSQPIPNRGMSYTWYKIEEPDTILAMLTQMPEENDIKIYAKPPVKKLFAPERCEIAQESEFMELWKIGENKNGAQGQD